MVGFVAVAVEAVAVVAVVTVADIAVVLVGVVAVVVVKCHFLAAPKIHSSETLLFEEKS